MPSFSAQALVLKKTKLGETDAILTLLAADGNQLRAVAKGARKPGSRVGGRSEPFTVIEALLHVGKSLDIISDVRTIATNAAVRDDYDKLIAASVVAEFLCKASEPGETVPRLFDLSCATLEVMGLAPADAAQKLLAAFLIKAMAMLGYSPLYDRVGTNPFLQKLFAATLTDVVEVIVPARSQTKLLRLLSKFIDDNLPLHLKTLDFITLSS
jgi:DNA repair protein RecO (recombination protein O)